MRKDTFTKVSVEPSELFSFVKDTLKQEGFSVTSEEVRDGFYDVHARKSGVRNVVKGAVRDADAVISGTKEGLHVQLHAGIWGRDLAVPALEGVVTAGAAAAAELHSAYELERRLWEKVVHRIDPSLLICQYEGLTFKSEEDLKLHLDMHSMLRETLQTERMMRETEYMQYL